MKVNRKDFLSIRTASKIEEMLNFCRKGSVWFKPLGNISEIALQIKWLIYNSREFFFSVRFFSDIMLAFSKKDGIRIYWRTIFISAEKEKAIILSDISDIIYSLKSYFIIL